MDILTFISEVLRTLAWPATVLILASIFRKDLAALLSRISAFKHKDTELTFGQELAEAADKVAASHHEKLEWLNEPEAIKTMALLDISPSAAVISAWVEFESTARSILKWDVQKPHTSNQLIKELVNRELLEEEDAEFLKLLQTIRNKVVHGYWRDLDKETGTKVTVVLHQLSWEIRNPRKAK